MPSPSLLLGVGTVLSTLSTTAFAAVYEQKEKFDATNWLDGFQFETYEKTNGYVNYLNEKDAKSSAIYGTTGGDVLFGVDSSETLKINDPNTIGRKSVRLEGKKDYNHGLFIIDIKQMPSACGMWPAFWSLGREPWPVKGEIDIVEGVNQNTNNKYVLHTDTSCKVDGKDQSNPQSLSDCALDGPNQASGCDVNDKRTNSFGQGFNMNGGGIYAMEWTSEAIKTWFFPRGTSLPAGLTGTAPNTDLFGQPAANFKGDCNIDERFKDQRFIFTNTFCGDWAGNVYAQSNCPKYYDSNGNMLDSMTMCKKFVAENPKAFKDAYWRIKSFRTFQKKTIVSSSSVAPSSTPVSSSHSSSIHASSSVASSSIPVSSSVASSSIHASSTQASSSVPASSTPASSSIQSSSAPVSSSVASASSTPVHDDSASSSIYSASVSSSSEILSASSSVYSASASSSIYSASASSSVYSASESSVYDASTSSSVYDISTSYSVYPTGSASSSVYDPMSTPDVHSVSSSYGSYDGYPSDTALYPVQTSSSAAPYPVYPAGNSSIGYPGTAHATGYAASSSKPQYQTYDESHGSAAQSTPCASSSVKKAYETNAYPVYPGSKSSAVVYGEYPSKPSKPAKNDYPYLPDFTPVSPIYPEVTHKSVWNNGYGYDTYPEGSKTIKTTTYTTDYVDVCETGYTTIKTTHVVTYTVSPTPVAQTTPASGYPVYPPPGFEITTKVCNKGCGEGPKTVTVTLPCHECGGYPVMQTGKISTPVPAVPTQPAQGYNTIYSKVYATKVVTISKIVSYESQYPAQHPSSAVYGGDVPSNAVYTPVAGKPGKPAQPSSGYGYPASNGTMTYATGAVKPTASKTGYNTPEFTGAASSFKAGGMIAAVAFAAMLL